MGFTGQMAVLESRLGSTKSFKVQANKTYAPGPLSFLDDKFVSVDLDIISQVDASCKSVPNTPFDRS